MRLWQRQELFYISGENGNGTTLQRENVSISSKIIYSNPTSDKYKFITGVSITAKSKNKVIIHLSVRDWLNKPWHM